MLTILVDYENVYGSDGLNGVSDLTKNDKLIIFFSDSCKNISQENLDCIEQSGCEFEIVKLKKIRKNALDFYIAAKVGSLCEKGETQIAIITNDKGFESIKDYVSDAFETVQIVISSKIQIALSKIGGPSETERRKALQYRMKKVNLEQEFNRIQNRNERKKQVESVFTDTKYEKKVDKVIDFLDYMEGKSKKSIYTGALHVFGRNDGNAIYGLLRDVISF
ncbi:MAG: hypothetical protein J6K43_05985 [Lachnospiraceae bacterium]|nr:hypothetical protein [Lachnospiraceae bacterium]